MIKCFTEGPKALAKSPMCSQTIAAPSASINNVRIYMYLSASWAKGCLSLLSWL